MTWSYAISRSGPTHAAKSRVFAATEKRAVIRMLQPYFTQAKKKEGVNIENPDYVDQIYVENALEPSG